MNRYLLPLLLLTACDKNPVEQNIQQVDISADSVVVGVYTSPILVAIAVRDGNGAQRYGIPLKYNSRDETIAKVSPSGAISGVGIGSTIVVATLADNPNSRDSVRVRVSADSCSGARPDLGGLATAADRAKFSYDVNAPLNLQKTLQSTTNGVEMSSISYSSPDGGAVTGYMWEPVGRTGPRPGMILMHGHPSNAAAMSNYGQSYARYGAVVIAIDAPFARRAGGSMTLQPLDAFEQIQVIKDLQRAVDVLRSRPNVDADRIAYVGFSWGGATGALFIGIERRLKAAALVVGHPGQVTLATGPDGFKNISFLACAARVTWLKAMLPVEPIRYVGNANMPLLLQNGMTDEFIPAYQAAELHQAAPQPKTIFWYETGHSLNLQAVIDRHGWLVQQIGIDPYAGL